MSSSVNVQVIYSSAFSEGVQGLSFGMIYSSYKQPFKLKTLAANVTSTSFAISLIFAEVVATEVYQLQYSSMTFSSNPSGCITVANNIELKTLPIAS